MKEVRETLFDDLAWKQSEEKVEAEETIEFSFEGQDLTIDLSGDNAALFREVMRSFVDAGTPAPKKTSGRKKAAPATAGATAPKKASSPAKGGNDENQQIREWAAANGFELSERGRIPQQVKDAWAAAQHGKSQGEVAQDKLTDQVPAEPSFDAVSEDAEQNAAPEPATVGQTV